MTPASVSLRPTELLECKRHDIYGRRLAYVYLDDRNYERELLREGYARLLVIEPNHAHARDMLDDELNARAHRVGLWGACGDAPCIRWVRASRARLG